MAALHGEESVLIAIGTLAVFIYCSLSGQFINTSLTERVHNGRRVMWTVGTGDSQASYLGFLFNSSRPGRSQHLR